MKFKFNILAKLNPTRALLNAVDVAHPRVPNMEKVQTALDLGAKLDAKNENGKTALNICAEKFALLMREEESIPLTRAIQGEANLVEGHYAAQAEGFLTAAKALIKAGADQTGTLALLTARGAEAKSVEAFATLLDTKKPAPAAPSAAPTMIVYPSIH